MYDSILVSFNDNELARTIRRDNHIDIGAVRVEHNGRTYHLVADDVATDHQRHYQSCNCLDDNDKCCRDDCACDDAPAAAVDDDLDRLRNDYIDAHAEYITYHSYCGPIYDAHRALVAALRAAAGANTPSDPVAP